MFRDINDKYFLESQQQRLNSQLNIWKKKKISLCSLKSDCCEYDGFGVVNVIAL